MQKQGVSILDTCYIVLCQIINSCKEGKIFDLNFANDNLSIFCFKWNAHLFMLFTLFAVISGYVSNSMYKQISGNKWAWNLILTASLFGGIYSSTIMISAMKL